MKFVKDAPKVSNLKELKHFSQFLKLGQKEFCDFLLRFLNFDQNIAVSLGPPLINKSYTTTTYII